MIYRIEVEAKIFDARTDVRKRWLESIGIAKKIKGIDLADVYTIEKNLTSQQLKLVSSMLSNPIAQRSSLYPNGKSSKVKLHKTPKIFDWAIEVGFLPGVTDNVANTAREAIEDLLKTGFGVFEGVYTTQLTFISGKLSKEEIYVIGENLANPLIQRVHIKNYQEFKRDRGMDFVVPKVKLEKLSSISFVDLNIDDTELMTIGKSGIMGPDGKRRGPLALSLLYMKTIQSYFKKLGRNPTDIELESIAQTWSEHCKHTIFADPIDGLNKGLFESYIKKATEIIRKEKGEKDFCVSVFTDNSGAISFDDNYLITHKVETHNSPSALDPFGGAITGIVGVNRDALGFGLGAKPIVNTYGFCFDDPNDEDPIYRAPNYKMKMLSPRRIMKGVIEGVNSGGNCSGIPTPQGFMYFDKGYKGKPLVFVGTVGLIPKKVGGKPSHIKKAKPGDYIVMAGGRVGIDGIHGATFSSEALDWGSPATAVQIGDPITQKKLSDAIVKEARHDGLYDGITDTQRILSEAIVEEVRDFGLYNSITDNGAGGLSCSVSEMAKESEGCEVWLEKVPLKYPGLEPWQIWISESQERMTLAVPKEKWDRFSELMKKRGVEASIIGKFTDSKQCIVKYHDKTIMDIDMHFLHNGLPRKPLMTSYAKSKNKKITIPKAANLTTLFHKMISRLNIASYEFISGQFDHEVQGGIVLKPLQGRGRVNAEATVIKPVLSSNKGIVISQGLSPSYSDIDTYSMAASSIDTAIRNVVCAGANPDYIALLDNFCWCSPDEPERLGQLLKAVKACYDYAISYKTPFISGKDSMFNDFKGFDKNNKPIKISISPTLLISSIGLIDDVKKSVSIDVKFPGDLIYVLGQTEDKLGGSEYLALLSEKKNAVIQGDIPGVDALKNMKIYRSLFECIEKNLISSAISVTKGGLAAALAKTSMAGMLGINVSLKKLSSTSNRVDFALFSQSQGRIILSISPENKTEFEKLMKGNIFSEVGEVTNDKKITIKDSREKTIVDTSVDKVIEMYKSTFKGY